MNPKSILRSFCVLLSIAAMISAAPSASADGGRDSHEQIADLVADAAADAAPANPIGDADADVEVSMSPEEGIQLTSASGAGLAVSLPRNVDVSKGVTTNDGTVVYLGEGAGTDVTVEPQPDGVRVSTVLHTANANHSFEYALPQGTEAQMGSDGRIALVKTVEVEDSTATAEVTVGYVEPAWAVDAEGRSIETFYEVADGVITQQVLTTADTTYPVVADPKYVIAGAVAVVIYWNKAETKTIANGGWIATGAIAACTAAGTAVGGVAGGAAGAIICGSLGAKALYTAGVAQNSSPRKCLSLMLSPWSSAATRFLTYSGGYCK